MSYVIIRLHNKILQKKDEKSQVSVLIASNWIPSYIISIILKTQNKNDLLLLPSAQNYLKAKAIA